MFKNKEQQITAIRAFIASIEMLFNIIIGSIKFSISNKSAYENDYKRMYPIKQLVEDVFSTMPEILPAKELTISDYGSGIGNILMSMDTLYNSAAIYMNSNKKFTVNTLRGYEKHASLLLKSKILLKEAAAKHIRIQHLDFTNINCNVDDKNNKDGTQHIVFCNTPFIKTELNHCLYAYLINFYPIRTLFIFPNHRGFGHNKTGLKVINNRIFKKMKGGQLY